MDDWTQPAIYGLVAASAPFIYKLLTRSKSDAPIVEGDHFVLAYSRRIRGLYFVGAVIFGAIAVGVCLFPVSTLSGQLGRAGGVLLPALAALVCVLEPRVRHVFDDTGIDRGSPFTGSRRILWANVSRIEWSDSLYWFVLSGRGGTIRVSLALSGMTALASILLRTCDSAIVDAATRERLRLIAAGDPRGSDIARR